LFDKASISGGSDSCSINENKLRLNGSSSTNIDLMSKGSCSSSCKDIIIAANHEDDSIDIQFQKYASIKKSSICEEDFMTSTKNDDNQSVPSALPKRRFSSLKSKLSSKTFSTSSKNSKKDIQESNLILN
jgi:hypothetical protein